MPIARFKKDIENDIWNWYHCINGKPGYGFDWSKNAPRDVYSKIKGKQLEDVKPYLKKRIHIYYKDGFVFFNTKLKPYWKRKEKKIITRLEKIHGKKFPVKHFDIYYTSFKRCPYKYENGRFLMMLNEYDKNPDRLCNIITHELMHLFFSHYYWKFCRKQGLNENQISNLKEALTVIMNTEFGDMLSFRDVGYKMHKPLREYLEKQWLKEKNFRKMLLSVCKYMKENKLFINFVN